jgi:hypothetical protein
MANIQNLVPGGYKLTLEEQKKGGIASGQARKRNAIIRNSLQKILNSNIKIPDNIEDKDIKDYMNKLQALGVNTKEVSLVDLMNLGQILGAIGSKPECYRALLESSGELEKQEEVKSTPSISINVIDNSNLEKVMYEGDE